MKTLMVFYGHYVYSKAHMMEKDAAMVHLKGLSQNLMLLICIHKAVGWNQAHQPHWPRSFVVPLTLSESMPAPQPQITIKYHHLITFEINQTLPTHTVLFQNKHVGFKQTALSYIMSKYTSLIYALTEQQTWFLNQFEMLISNIDANILNHNKLFKKTALTIFHMYG
jgi:hypothetical protein